MEKIYKKYLFLSFVFAILFALVLILIKLGFFFGIDTHISNYIQASQTNCGIKFMKIISFIGSRFFDIGFSFLLFFFFYIRKEHLKFLFYFGSLGLGVVLSFIIHNIVKRARPVNPFKSDYSFPSDHVVSSVIICYCISYFIWNKNKSLAIAFLFLPILVGLSRIYLNVHWFSDILGGFLLGLACFFFGVFIFDKYKLKRMG